MALRWLKMAPRGPQEAPRGTASAAVAAAVVVAAAGCGERSVQFLAHGLNF